jgi:hypothetical protein
VSAAAPQTAPAVWELVSGDDDRGNAVFSVLVKRTYLIGGDNRPVRAAADAPLRKIDEYYDGGDPLTSTVKFEGDLVAWKPATDVVVIGKAYAPGGEPCTEMEIAVEAGRACKRIMVIGDRRCTHRMLQPPRFSAPEPFSEMEIRYERAYGGKDEKSDPRSPFFYPRNHQGRGIAIKNKPEIVEGLMLPNFEDPDDLLTPDRLILEKPANWADQPQPQGVGWYQRTWYPRSVFAGSVPGFLSIDCITAEESLGLVPRDHLKLARQFKLPAFDVRFNNGASPGLAVAGLKEGDLIRLVNMSPSGELLFHFPGDPPSVLIDIGLGECSPPAAVHTVCIRADDGEVDIVWRFACVHPGIGWLPEMKKLNVEVG